MKKIYHHTTFKVIFLVFLIGTLFLTFYDYNKRNEVTIQNNLISITEESNELLNTAISEKLKSEMQILKSYAAMIAEENTMDASVLAKVEPLLEHELFSRIAITDADGISYTSDHFQHDSSKRSYYLEGMAGNSYISNKMTSVLDQSEIIVMSVPVYHEDTIIGVLRGTLNTDALYDYFSMSILSGNVSSSIIQSDGTNISLQANEDLNFLHLLEINDVDGMLIKKTQQNLQNHENGSLHFQLDGKERYACYSHIANTDWYVLSILPYSLVDLQLRIDFTHTIILAIKIGVVFLLFGLYVFFLKKEDSHKIKAINRQLDAIISNTPGAAYKHEIDKPSTITLFNHRKSRFLGYTHEELLHMIQHDLFNLIHSEDYEGFIKKLHEMVPDKIYTSTYRIFDKQKNMHWCYDQRQVIVEEGKQMCYVEVLDITDLKKAQEQLKISEERYQLILQESKSVIFEWNIDSDCITFSDQWISVYGYPKEISSFLVLVQKKFDGKEHTFIPLIEHIFISKHSEQIDCILPKADGSEAWVRIIAKPLFDEEGYVLRVIGSISDISQEKQRTLRLQKQAQQDGLTNLYNRATSESMINQALGSSTLTHHILFVLDVDNFKTINDTLGHSTGDEALRKIADALRSCLRSHDLIGRIGGDEFIVLISVTQAWNAEQINQKCSQFLQALHKIELSQCIGYRIQCSIGIAVSPIDGTTYQDLFDLADKRLYEAKKQGKNTYIYK